METKIKNLVRYIVSESDKTPPKWGTDRIDFGEFEYKEVKINLPLEVIEELREWSDKKWCYRYGIWVVEQCDVCESCLKAEDLQSNEGDLK